MDKRKLISLLFAFVLLVAVGRTASAQDKKYYWEFIDVDITVLENSDIRVVETQKFVFTQGSFHFAYRNIPMDRLESVTDVSVSEGGMEYRRGSEDPGTFTTSREDGDFRITWYYPYTSDAARTFDIAYTVKGGLRFYEGGDQLWWKAVFPDRSFPVRSSRVTVHLPAGISREELKTAAYFTDADVEIVDGSTVVFTAGDIKPGQELEVRVQFPHGIVEGQPPSWQVAGDRLADYNTRYRDLVNLAFGALGLLIPIVGFVALYLLWYTRGRDVPVGVVADYLAEPPSDLPPGLAGALVDEKADMKDIVATIVDLARRGVIHITEEEEPGFLGIGKRRDFLFELLEHNEQLQSYEKTLLRKFFGRTRKRIYLSDLKDKFYTAIPGMRSQMYKEVVRRGFFPRSPEATRKMYLALGAVMVVGAVVLGVGAMVFLFTYADTAFCPAAGIFLVGLVLVVVGQVMPRKTREGALAAAKWRAFERYLRGIEKYTNLERAQEIFEKYLPYAIAFGLERQWVSKFAEVNTPAPTWYHPYPPVIVHGGPGRRGGVGTGVPDMGEGGASLPSLQGASDGMMVSLQSMSDGLFSMLNSASSTLSSSPSSSGGGFSGGGGGGGGGGGAG